MTATGLEPKGARRRVVRRAAALAALVLPAAALAVSVAAAGMGTDQAEDDGDTRATPATATVQRRTLTEKDEVDGTLGYGDTRPVVNRGTGTVTGLAAEGSVVERNGILYQLDGKAVRLLYGDVPAYRRLAEGVGDGPDVAQLEAGLKELGFTRGLISTPDDSWDSATTAAVKRWEKALGLDQDGVVEDGEVVFLPGAARIASHETTVGATAQPGGTVFDVTGTTRQVSVDLDARKQRLAQQGARVEVEFPDGTATSATISSLGTVAKTDGGSGGQGGGTAGGGSGSESKPKIKVTVSLDDPAAGGGLDGAPVKVRLVQASRENVLAVPVNALLALREGGYALEVVDGASRRLVAVETGMFSAGWVEVSGEGVAEGMRVVVPR